MLEYMRKNAGSWIIKILLFGIVVVFAFWGVAPSGQDASTVMTIDKVKVPYNEYRDIYNNLLESYRQIYENLDSATLEFLDLKGQAKKALLERYLLLEAARRLEVTATPEEISAQITSTPAFQENGIFLPERYQMFLDYNRTTPEAYEASLSRDIIISKVTDLIKVSAVVTPQEVNDNLMLLTREAVATVLTLTPNDFVRKVPALTEDDLKEYFEDHIELYRVPETFRQAVAIIDPADFASDIVVSTQDMEDLYEDLAHEFLLPATYRVRHILFSLPEEASAESIGEVRTLAEKIVTRIREEETSFAEAAQEYSADRDSAALGGDLGFLEAKELDRTVLDAIRDLEEGEISDPVPTANGFEVVQGGEYRKERTRPFEEVREEIEERLRQEQAFDLAYDLADDLLDAIESTGRSLDDLAGEKGLTIMKTRSFSRDTPLETLELPEDLLQAAFATEEEEVGDIYEQDGKLYLFQTIERKDPYLPDLEDVREDVEGGLIVQRSMELALEKAEQLLEELKGGKSLDSLAATMRRKAVRTGPFTIMDTSLPEFDDAEQIIRTAFTIPNPGDGAVASGRQAHYLVVLTEILHPEDKDLEEKRSTVKEALKYQREQEVLNGYIQELQEEMKDRIEIKEDML